MRTDIEADSRNFLCEDNHIVGIVKSSYMWLIPITDNPEVVAVIVK